MITDCARRRRRARRTVRAPSRPDVGRARRRTSRQLRRAEEDRARRRVESRCTSRISATRSSATKVNIGAGTITCNYDGVQETATIIEDGAFIGSDTQLIAPVTVGEGAYVGTGTTVREDVPPARSRSAPASSGTSRAGSSKKKRRQQNRRS